jgi:hypothetical protein
LTNHCGSSTGKPTKRISWTHGAGWGQPAALSSTAGAFSNATCYFYSGLGFSTDIQKAMDAAASDYLVKPFLGDLGKVVRDLVTEAAAMGSGSSPDDKIGH